MERVYSSTRSGWVVAVTLVVEPTVKEDIVYLLPASPPDLWAC